MSSVSAIVPCYNYGHFLRDCVESVLMQEGVDVRVLIIDDQSSDDTACVGSAIAERDPRVEFRRHAANRGNIETYNEGLAWASGDYTLLISADDMLLPGALLRATRLMDAHPEVGMVYGRVLELRADQMPPPARSIPSKGTARIIPGTQWLEAFCRQRGNGVISPEVLVRTSVQRRVGGYSKDLPHSGDIDMWARFALCGPIGVLDADQALYRVHAANMHLGRDYQLLWLLGDRRNAFRSAFSKRGSGCMEHRRIASVAYRSIANEALWAASNAFDRGEIHGQEMKESLRFASDTYPQAWRSRPYLAALARRICGQRWWRMLYRVRRGFDRGGVPVAGTV